MKVSPRQLEALRLIASGMFYPDITREDDGWHARWRPAIDISQDVDDVVASWLDEFIRDANISRLTAHAEDRDYETLHDAWLTALKSETGLIKWDDDECAEFANTLRDWQRFARPDSNAREKITFVLATKANSFFLQCKAPRDTRALHALGESVAIFPPLRAMRKEKKTKVLSVELSRAEAESFMRRGAHELAKAGYNVEGANLATEIIASAELIANSNKDDAEKVKAKLVIKVAGEVVSAAEIRFLLEQESTLVFFRNRWIEVDRNILREALRALERHSEQELTPMQAVAFASGIGAVGHLEIYDIRAHGWLRGLIHQLRDNTTILPKVDKIKNLNATLRDYQRRGVAWIHFLTANGFGALLADDMGLGKTIQTIAWILLANRESEKKPFLIVAPLTLLSNWRHEIAKFAPSLNVYIHQGSSRQLEKGFAKLTQDADIVITSYSLLLKDYSILRQTDWAGLILDEAQIIKNPDTKVSRAARALGARRRLALTGTPIENSVADVWAIEEFLNPTFLGDRKTFRDRFEKPIAQDERSVAGKKLRRALEPFILRRLKSDEAIAKELGEKREIKEYCPLSLSQRAAYETALNEFRFKDRQSGDIFALLTELKLICDGAGKMERLFDLLESIFDAGESALIFTQYAKVGAEIRDALAKKFNRDFPFIHGALDARAREKTIASFVDDKNPSAFILSLRTGGFGLNLTKATHVIHFDRWWNPAVENQATDRAHRIGQDKTVFVHMFITEGTLEEHIDDVIERKSRVAGSLIANGENFLRDLAPEEFEKIVSLSDSNQ